VHLGEKFVEMWLSHNITAGLDRFDLEDFLDTIVCLILSSLVMSLVVSCSSTTSDAVGFDVSSSLVSPSPHADRAVCCLAPGSWVSALL